MLHPRTQAIAFRIWAYCEPRGWDVTATDIAEALGLSTNTIGQVLGVKGWQSRTRAGKVSEKAGMLFGPTNAAARYIVRSLVPKSRAGIDE